MQKPVNPQFAFNVVRVLLLLITRTRSNVNIQIKCNSFTYKVDRKHKKWFI